MFGSPALSVGGGTIADVWAPQDRGLPMAVLVSVPFLGPSLGWAESMFYFCLRLTCYRPVIGSYVVEAKGWRWTQ